MTIDMGAMFTCVSRAKTATVHALTSLCEAYAVVQPDYRKRRLNDAVEELQKALTHAEVALEMVNAEKEEEPANA